MPAPTILDIGPATPLVAEGGKTTRLALPVPTMGEVTRLFLQQVTITATSGVVTAVAPATDGFTYSWYAAEAGCPLGVDKPVLAVYEDQYRLAPETVVEAGDSMVTKDDKPDDFGQSFAYVNRDGGHSTRRQRLYLKIKPNGTGNKTFILFMTIKPGSAS